MDAASELFPERRVLVPGASDLAQPLAQARRMAGVIRGLATKAGYTSGLPIGMASVATALWTRFHKFDAADPRWPDRDRFILSAGHDCFLHNALLYLTAHDGLSPDDLLPSRPSESAPPANRDHPAVEAAHGPPGHGLAAAVGMALAERNMAARFGKSLVDHRTWVIAAGADLMDGISLEAACLAGDLGLSKLTVLCDDEDLSSPDDVLKRFAACGWTTKQVDSQDLDRVNASLSFAVRSKKPTLIACRSVIAAQDLPAASAGTNGVADPLPSAAIAVDLRERWIAIGSRGASARRSWLKRLARHQQRAEFERVLSGRLPDTWHATLITMKQQIGDDRPMQSSRTTSEQCLEALMPATPELISCAGDATRQAGQGRGGGAITAGHYGGRTVGSGIHRYALAGAANGMALHGGLLPCIGAAVAFGDGLRPALRLAAFMRQRLVCTLAHDAAGAIVDGPMDHPADSLASLRAMPGLHVFRPGDAMEIAECWELALRRLDGPSLLVLSGQLLPTWRTDPAENRCARGGYVLAEADGPRQATIIATGSELPIAMEAREKLAGDNIATAVVSLPCWELFAQQDKVHRAEVLGGAPRVAIEAAAAFGWEQWLGPQDSFIGMTGFAPSAHYPDLCRHFGITAEAVVAAVLRRF